MKEESLLLLSDLQKLINQVVLIDYTIIILEMCIRDRMYGYSTDLRAMSGGMGEFSYEFARYEQAPQDVQKKIIEAAEKEEQ